MAAKQNAEFHEKNLCYVLPLKQYHLDNKEQYCQFNTLQPISKVIVGQFVSIPNSQLGATLLINLLCGFNCFGWIVANKWTHHLFSWFLPHRYVTPIVILINW